MRKKEINGQGVDFVFHFKAVFIGQNLGVQRVAINVVPKPREKSF